MQKETPKTLADIYPEEAVFLSAIKKFIKPFKEQYKKLADKNREIKEHNTVAHEIYIKIKNKKQLCKSQQTQSLKNLVQRLMKIVLCQ